MRISLAFSCASWRMKLTICRIWAPEEPAEAASPMMVRVAAAAAAFVWCGGGVLCFVGVGVVRTAVGRCVGWCFVSVGKRWMGRGWTAQHKRGLDGWID